MNEPKIYRISYKKVAASPFNGNVDFDNSAETVQSTDFATAYSVAKQRKPQGWEVVKIELSTE